LDPTGNGTRPDRNRFGIVGVIFGMRAPWLVLLLAMLVAGCGDSSGHRKAEKRQVTLPAYGSFRATTETVTTGSPRICRFDAKTLADDAVKFLVPSPTPPDIYFIGARTAFYDFKARRCDAALLRAALSQRLTATQLHVLLPRFPFLDASVG
jgi:hypothetical protein